MEDRRRSKEVTAARGSGFAEVATPALYYVCSPEIDLSDGPLDGQTPTVGPAWANEDGGWAVVGGTIVSDDFGAVATIDAAHADVNVWMELVDGHDLTEIVFRFADLNNFWVGRIRDEGVSNVHDQIVEVLAGVATIKSSHARPDLTAGNPFLQVVVSGDDIRFVTDYNDFTINDASGNGRTIVGMRSKMLGVAQQSNVLFLKCWGQLDGAYNVSQFCD